MNGGHTKAAAHPWTAALALFMLILDAGVWLRGFVTLPPFGNDFTGYRDAAQQWLTNGRFYLPAQLAGPYHVWDLNPQPVLYPPTSLWLFAPFTVLPAVLWWAIPLAIIAWSLRSLRGPRLALALGLALWPPTVLAIWVGNPNLWIMAALALATRFPAFAPWVLLKPSLAPFALYRLNRRQWWLGLAVLGLASVPFGAMWLDWITAVRNADQSLLYSVFAVPTMALPLLGPAEPVDRATSPSRRLSRANPEPDLIYGRG